LKIDLDLKQLLPPALEKLIESTSNVGSYSTTTTYNVVAIYQLRTLFANNLALYLEEAIRAGFWLFDELVLLFG
jgi:hypothetical protein